MGFPGLIWLYDLFLNLKASLLASLLLLSPSIAHSPLSSQSDFSYQVYQRSISALLLKILQELPSAIRRTSHSLPSSLAHSLSTLIPTLSPAFSRLQSHRPLHSRWNAHCCSPALAVPSTWKTISSPDLCMGTSLISQVLLKCHLLRGACPDDPN